MISEKCLLQLQINRHIIHNRTCLTHNYVWSNVYDSHRVRDDSWTFAHKLGSNLFVSRLRHGLTNNIISSCFSLSKKTKREKGKECGPNIDCCSAISLAILNYYVSCNVLSHMILESINLSNNVRHYTEQGGVYMNIGRPSP